MQFNPLWLKSTVLLKYFFPDVIWVPNRSNVRQKMNPPLIRPLVKKIISMAEFVHACNYQYDGRPSMQLMNSSFTKMVVTFIIFIASRSKFPGTLRIHIYRCTMIHDPIGLTDRALIVSQKLTIFCLLPACFLLVIACMDEFIHPPATTKNWM